MRRSNQNLVTITLLVIACALTARFVGGERATAPRTAATPGSGGTPTALPTISPRQRWSLPPIDRSVPWRPGLHAPATVGPSERVELAGPTAVPVSAGRPAVSNSAWDYWVRIREGARVRKVALGVDRWRRSADQWSCRSYPLPSGVTITVGLAGETMGESYKDTLGVEGEKDGRLFPQPSFAPLLTDESLWDHRSLNELKYQSGRGLWNRNDHAIRGAFVGPDCITLLVTWYECGCPSRYACCYCVVRLTPTATSWKVEVVKHSLVGFQGDVSFIPFRDTFLVFDGWDALRFDARGNLVGQVKWPFNGAVYLGTPQYEAGMLLLWFGDQDLHKFIGCMDPRSGRALGKFDVTPPGDALR